MAQQAGSQPKTSANVSARALCLFAVLVTMPFPTILHEFSHEHRRFDLRTPLYPVDVALFILIASTGPSVVRAVRARRLGAGGGMWLLLVGVMSIAWLAHPSQRGAHTLVELLGVVAIAHVLASTEADDERRLLLGTVGAIAVMEAAWAVTQRITLRPLGLERLGELPDPFYRFGPGAIAPQGSMFHIYVLAGLALVSGAIFAAVAISTERRAWLALVAVAIAPVGLTYSRAAAIGLALLVTAVALNGALPVRRRSLLVAGALLVGAVVPALVWSGGWRNRANQTTGATSAAALTTERGHLNSQAFKTIRAYPILGVGPGRYVPYLEARYHRDPVAGEFKPVHDVLLLAAAEGGLVAGALMFALLLVVGWRAWQSGGLAIAIFLGYLPFVLLDHFPYTYAQGIVITGLWLGSLDYLARRRVVRAPSG